MIICVRGIPCLCSHYPETINVDTHLAEIYRHMIPILTNRARRQTPKPGSNAIRVSLPRSQPALFERIDIKLVVVEQVKEFDIPILEEVLCAILSYFCQTVTNKIKQESSPHDGHRYSKLRLLEIQIGKSTWATDRDQRARHVLPTRGFSAST